MRFLSKSGTFLGVHVSFREHIGLRTLGTSRFFLRSFLSDFRYMIIVVSFSQRVYLRWSHHTRWAQTPMGEITQSPSLIYILPFIGGSVKTPFITIRGPPCMEKKRIFPCLRGSRVSLPGFRADHWQCRWNCGLELFNFQPEKLFQTKQMTGLFGGNVLRHCLVKVVVLGI